MKFYCFLNELGKRRRKKQIKSYIFNTIVVIVTFIEHVPLQVLLKKGKHLALIWQLAISKDKTCIFNEFCQRSVEITRSISIFKKLKLLASCIKRQ